MYICINNIYKSASKDIYNIFISVFFTFYSANNLEKKIVVHGFHKNKAAQLFSTLTLKKYFLISKSAY